MAKIAYIRVSTKEQNTARQDSMFEGYDKIFTEKISGKSTDRPELKKLMEYVREGDTVTVESYSRFARSTKDLLNLVSDLESKSVSFISIKEKVDTSTPQGRFEMNIFASLAQFERELILQRQAEGIAEAKKIDNNRRAHGLEPLTYKGRKPIDIDMELFMAQLRLWRAGKQTAVKTMNQLHLKPNTFYRRVKELEGK